MRSELDRFRDEDARRRNSEQALKQVVMHHVGDLAFRKRQRAIVAAVSGGIAVVLGLISGLSSGLEDLRAVLGFAALFFALVGAAVGAIAWGLATRERFLELDLEEAGETLSDRASVAGALDELGLDDAFDREELNQAIEGWEIPDGHGATSQRRLAGRGRETPLADTAAKIGPRDFGKLLLTKGIELGLIVDETVTDDSGKRRYGFRRV